jgi:undecaprenyl diphosphate synthase
MTGVPQCVGIILDGNRRWANEKGLPTLEGHRRGTDNIEKVTLIARDIGIKHVALRFVGQLERFSDGLQKAMRNAENNSPKEPVITLWVCVSYGGRAEVVRAAQQIKESGEEITGRSPTSSSGRAVSTAHPTF